MRKTKNSFNLLITACIIDFKRFILNITTDLLILQNKSLCNGFVTKLSVSVYNDIKKFTNSQCS